MHSVLFITIFLCLSCSGKPIQQYTQRLTKEERADLEYFFRLLLFHDRAIFVLFGNKPVTLCNLIDSEKHEEAFNKWFNTLQEDEKIRLQGIALEQKKSGKFPNFKRNPYKGWEVWNKLKEGNYPKRYLLVAHPEQIVSSLGVPSGVYDLFLVNIQQTVFILGKHYAVFRNIVGYDFDPLEKVFELENSDSDFWLQVLNNHQAHGLLCGFGEKNVLFFEWSRTYETRTGKVASYLNRCPLLMQSPSTYKPCPFGSEGPDNFDIPAFQASFEDEIVEQFLQEKAKIQKIYKGKDMLEVTLERFFS